MNRLRTIFALLVERPLWALALLLVLGFTLRVAMHLELADTPYHQQHAWHETDMAFFVQWADHLAEEDWLDREGQHPLHGWHRLVAQEHFLRQGVVEPPADGAKLLWEVWYGGPRFHQEPLYAYALAAVKPVVGVAGFLVLQVLLGLASIVLVYCVTRTAFGSGAALATGLLAVVFGPFLFYEGVLLRVAWLLFAALAILLLAQRVLATPTRWRLVALGLSLGLAVLLKTTFLLFAGCVLVAAALGASNRSQGIQRVSLVAAGLVAALLPAVLRNIAVGAPVMALSSVGPVTFINANAADFVPGTGFFISRHCEPLMAAHYDSFAGAAQAAIATHDSLAAWLWFWARKALLFFAPHETPNNTSIAYYESLSVVLRWLQVGFLWVALPAVAGLALAWRRGRAAALPLAAFLCGWLPLAAFYNLSRFRTAVVGLLLPFAGLAVVEVAALLRQRRWRPLAVPLAAAVLVIGGAWLAAPAVPAIRTADHLANNQGWRTVVTEAEATEGPDEALAVVRRALATAPATIAQAENKPPDPSPANLALARSFGPLYMECARLAAAVDDRPTATTCYRQAGALHRFLNNPGR